MGLHQVNGDLFGVPGISHSSLQTPEDPQVIAIGSMAALTARDVIKRLGNLTKALRD